RLEHDIADEAVADDHVDRALEDVVAFDIAAEVQRAAAQQLGRLFDDLVALDDFFADVQQTDGGIVAVVDRLGQGRAHDGELQQVFGGAVDIGAQVEHGGGPAGLVRDGRGDGRTVDAVQRFEHIARNGHPGAGIAGRDTSVGAAVLDRLGSQPPGGVFLAAQGDLDRVVHGHD